MDIRCCSCISGMSERRVQVVDFKAPCMFYRKKGESFTLDQLVPPGVCHDLFFAIYPTYLSLIYDGQPHVTVSCPGGKGKTTWRVQSKKLAVSPLLRMACAFFRALGRPKDLISKKIVMECLNSEGDCPRGYKRGDSFEFNQYVHLVGRKFFCPAVYYSLYPFLTRPDASRIQCPADNTCVTFEICKME